jgi:hypothetical protein
MEGIPMIKRLTFATIYLIFLSAYFQTAMAGDWRFPLAISYVSGMQDIVDLYKTNIENEIPNSSVSSAGIPIGISFHPYYETDFGLGIGIGVGPIMYLYADASSYGSYEFTNIPVNADVRFNFLPKNSFAPYVRVGIRKNNASGDYVVSDEAGPYYAIGAEFRSLRRVQFGVELAKDNSKVEFYEVDQYGNRSGTKKISPTDTMITFYIIF